MVRSNHGSSFEPRKKRKSNDASSSSDDDSRSEEAKQPAKLKDQHADAVETTNSFTVQCMPDYRRRVKKVQEYLQTEYPDVYNEVVYELTSEEKADKTRHYHNATHSFFYDQFPTKFLQSFLSNQWKDEEKEIRYTYDQSYSKNWRNLLHWNRRVL